MLDPGRHSGYHYAPHTFSHLPLMARLTIEHDVDDTGLTKLRTPRNDVVAEQRAGVAEHQPDSFELRHGPFKRYSRRLTVRAGSRPGQHRVTETIEYALAAPVWAPLLAWPVRRAMRRRKADGTQPWWAPPQRLDARQSTVLSLIAVLAIVSAYLGTTLSQSVTFVAEEFGAGTGSQGVVLATARVGIVVALAATALSDRAGRRMVRLLLLAACFVFSLAALSPALWFFGASQTVGRGLTIATDIILLVLATEEMPQRSRAWAAGILALIGGLGSGWVVLLLPLADRYESGWRLIFLPPLLFVPLVIWAGRRMPESVRFEARRAAVAAGSNLSRRVTMRSPEIARRLALLAVAAFLLLLFAAPASQFQNEFLRKERGFSGGDITAFTLLTSTPVGLGVYVGGMLAEGRGRRRIAAFGLTMGAVCTAASFGSRGAPMWLWALAGTVAAGLTVPAIRVYGPELFPTQLRGRANGLITLAAVIGSVTGLLLTGFLAEPARFGSITWPITMLAGGPLIVAVLVLTIYPETANRTLEELNPADLETFGTDGIAIPDQRRSSE